MLLETCPITDITIHGESQTITTIVNSIQGNQILLATGKILTLEEDIDTARMGDYVTAIEALENEQN